MCVSFDLKNILVLKPLSQTHERQIIDPIRSAISVPELLGIWRENYCLSDAEILAQQPIKIR